MKKSNVMMKKSNVILQAAIASALFVMAGSVYATTVSTLATAPVFAKELLQGTTPAATALTIPAANAIIVTANVGIPANSTVYVYVKLNGASISTIPSVIPAAALTATTISQADGSTTGAGGASVTLTASSLGTTTGSANPTAVGAGVDYVVFQVKTNTDVVGVGAELVRIGVAVPLVVNNAAALLTAPLTTTASIGIGAPTNRFGAFAASASNHDATSAAVNIATQAQGITFAAAPSTTAGQVDLTASPVSTLFTAAAINTNTINLGTITATDGTAVQANGATAYTIASQVTAANKLTAVLTVPAGFLAPLGTTGQLWLQATCTAAGATGAAAGGALAGSPSTVFTTAALAAAATSVTLTATAAPTTATALNVCMGINKTIAAIPGTPTLAATLIHAGTAIDSNETVAATLWPVTYNGSQVDVRNYVPAGVAGFQNIMRVINTGSVTASVSVALINETTGVVGTSGVVAANVPPGGTVRLNTAAIEAVIGAVASTARPRLRFTAPTNGLEVQNLMFSNGVYTSISQ